MPDRLARLQVEATDLPIVGSEINTVLPDRGSQARGGFEFNRPKRFPSLGFYGVDPIFARGAEAGYLSCDDDPIGVVVVHVTGVFVCSVTVDVAWPTPSRWERRLVGPLERKRRGELLVRYAAALVVVSIGGPIFRI